MRTTWHVQITVFFKKNLINTDQTLTRKMIQKKKTIKVLTDNTIKQHTVSSKEH